MSEKRKGDFANVNILELIDSTCEHFRKEIKSGANPKIEDFLKRVPDDAQANLFKSLLLLDIRYREKRGDSPRPGEYLSRFARFKQVIGDAFHHSTSISHINEPQARQCDGLAESQDTLEAPDRKRIGDYELLRELGRGGFGVVYEARHRKRGNLVALKTLPMGQDGQEINADRLYKFRREFRSLAEINHPNLIGMQTLEVDGDHWFFTMDLIDGVDFLSYVRAGDSLDAGRLLKAFRQLVAGIIALHERSIVHRDLKPSNVLVDSSGRLVILDFGLVAQLQKPTDQTASLRSAMFAGTPRYAAPEQMFGERSEASDWYAAGTMLFEALTGEPPFSGSQLELLRDKQEKDPPKLEGRAGIQAELAQLADSLIQREPSLRPSAPSIANTLEMGGDTRSFGTTGSVGTNDDEAPELLASMDEDIVLVGRENQLSQMEEAHRELITERHPIVVWIRGLSGEGKSALAEKFLQPFRRDNETLVLSGRCYDRESVPFKAIDSFIPPLVSNLRSRSKSEVESILPDDIAFLARLFPLLRRVESIAARATVDLSGIDSDRIRFRAFQALREMLGALSDRTPLVLFIDDLQWADSDSAPALFDLICGEEPPLILLIGSYRSDEANESLFLNDWARLTSQKEHFCAERRIEVHPLTREQCIELAQLRTGVEIGLLNVKADEFFGDSGGNPYFIEQLLDGFDSGAGTFERVPLEDIISQRLRQLPSESKVVLEYVAISGQPIAIDELTRVTADSATIVATVAHMRSERLVRLLGSGEDLRLDTYHDKIRETVVMQLPEKRRRLQHQRLAEAIEAAEQTDSEGWIRDLSSSPYPLEYKQALSPRVFDLAHHFFLAKDSRAFVFQLLAAEAAMQAFAVDDAMNFYTRVEELLPEDSSSQLKYRVAMGLARVLQWRKKTDLSIAHYTTALEVAEQSEQKVVAYRWLSVAAAQAGRFDDFFRWLDEALRELSTRRAKTLLGKGASFVWLSAAISLIPPKLLESRSVKSKRRMLLRHQVLERSTILYEKDFFAAVQLISLSALSAFRTGEQRNIGLGLAEVAHLWASVGMHPIARLFVSRSHKLVIDENDTEYRGLLDYYIGMSRYWSGELSEANTRFRDACVALSRCHDSFNLQVSSHMRRHVLAFLEPSSVELQQAQCVLELAQETGNAEGQCWGAYDVASALARQGKLETAMPYLSDAAKALRIERLLMTESIFSATHAFVRLQCSDYSGGREAAASAWRDAKRSRVLIDVSLLCLPIELECAIGSAWQEPIDSTEKRDVKRMLRRNSIMYRLLPNHRPQLLRVAGRVNWRMGYTRRAVSLFQKSVKLSQEKGMHYQRAKALIDLAAVKEEGRDENRAQAIQLLKDMDSVIPRAESWLLGDQYDEEVVAPEFDLEAWEAEHGAISSVREG